MDTVVPLLHKIPAPREEDFETETLHAKAEVRNVLNVWAAVMAKGNPRSLLIVAVDAEGKEQVMSGGAFDMRSTIGILEEIKFEMLVALSEARSDD